MKFIDNYFRDIQAMTVEGVRKNPDAAFAAKEYFQVLMYLERIGDYARNLCELGCLPQVWENHRTVGKASNLCYNGLY